MLNMVPCGGLQQIFENPPPENPSLLESLSSWKPIRSVKSIDHSYTELFGELHFRENPETALPSAFVSEAAASWSSSSSSSALLSDVTHDVTPFSCYSTMNSESLHLCTEGLGFESLDGVEDMKNDASINELDNYSGSGSEKAYVRESCMGLNQYKIAKSCGGSCPPPISSVGKSGKACVSYKSYRRDGRFVLEEVRIPTHECLRASREDGRLLLCLVHPNDCLNEEEDDDEEEEEENGDAEDGQ